MNVTRIAILGVAAIAAGAAALLVRGMVGGGTPASQASLPPPATTIEVLVASKDITPGHALDAGLVRWEACFSCVRRCPRAFKSVTSANSSGVFPWFSSSCERTSRLAAFHSARLRC